ncbi:phage tail protein I [Haematospirillum jordaniae]|uniref:phage tail protein I n=1 Tax=Haematospirillum jordaniae TaxID=1549855 RepID=UPI001432940A|nr:phage tail protein I [Haematospirillum jordaniae]NKD86607.1 phage tail protein I [Haematospirillum jordaniae]
MPEYCPSLLPGNATPAERALEQTLARLSDVPVPLRSLWNPDTCQPEHLPWLAWALSVDNWDPSWPTDVKRRHVSKAIDIQRRKGTAKSVRTVVNTFGANLLLQEWWQTHPPKAPHTFNLHLTLGDDTPSDAAWQQDIIREVERTKPVRSHFTLTVGKAATGGATLTGALCPVTAKRLMTDEEPLARKVHLGLKSVACKADFLRLDLNARRFVCCGGFGASGALRIASYTRIH